MDEPMTDEERQKLVASLRIYEHIGGLGPMCKNAAEELERLAEELRITNKALSMCSDECNKLYERYDKKLDEIERLAALAQSDAEPVKYEYRRHKGMGNWIECGKANYNANSEYEYRALYTAPPRPDASAGLIEAAEMAEECASECSADRKAPLSAYALRDFAKLLRAHAADRSGK